MTLTDGRTLTGVQLQLEYLDLARKYVEDRLGADADDQTLDVLARWESVLDRLERDPMLLAGELDWVAKLKLLEQYRQRDGLEWDDAKLQLIDLQYSDIRPEKGLYHRLVAGRPDRAARSTTPRSRRRCTTRRRTPAPTSGAAASRSSPPRWPPRPGTR